MTEIDLDVRLDAPLPRSIAVGGGTAVFVCGTAFSRRGAIRTLELVVDGERQPVADHGLPRLDLFTSLHPALDPFELGDLTADPDSDEDPLLTSYLSGFWGMALLRRGSGDRTIGLRAVLAGGEVVTGEPATIPARELPAAATPAAPADGPLVAICMATYDPPADLLRRQLDSLRDQTHANWVCIISDDCSGPEGVAAIEAAVGEDPRFVVSRSPRRLGFYHNFERALALAPATADYVAMADQDDRWHPDKLATLVGAIGSDRLVYSDARIISADGRVLADTYWAVRRNNHADISSLLMANSVTGAASLLERSLLDDALPFPPAQFAHFHDHWIALVARATGGIGFVDRPLYDYVQHDNAVLGHANANRVTELRDRLAKLRTSPRERIQRWRMHFYVDNCRLAQMIAVLELRCGDRIRPRARRALRSFARADRSAPALARIALRGVPEVFGRRVETLGAEVGLAFAFVWRRLIVASARGQRRPRRTLRLDSQPPPNFAPRPGRTGPDGAAPKSVAEKIAPLELIVTDDVEPRINILIPTIDLDHFFGGYIAKFNLARRLAERGRRVRIVTVDPVGALPRSWRRRIESYAGLEGMFEDVEVAFGRESQGIEVSRRDRFVASTWWSAHIAAAAVERLDTDRFLYLIQEYEPFTFPMGTYAALAEQSYRFPHTALFSTELLRDFFRRRAIGAYAHGTEHGDAASSSFQNAITAIDPPTAELLAGRTTRRLLFYARPEPHAARNMFELGVLALGRALELGAFDGWELHGIGTVTGSRRISLGGGRALELLPRSAQGEYAEVLRSHDVGLSLMFTPHPSLVPIEMASAGMLTITNGYENKTAEALAAISPNLIAAEPSIEAIATALAAAADAAGDAERRAAGSHVAWSRSWDQSFGDDVIDRVLTLLDAAPVAPRA